MSRHGFKGKLSYDLTRHPFISPQDQQLEFLSSVADLRADLSDVYPADQLAAGALVFAVGIPPVNHGQHHPDWAGE